MKHRLYRQEALEVIARKIISQYDPCLLNAPAPIPVESIMEKVYGLTIELQYIRNDGRILGETIFADCMIPIYERESGYQLIPATAGTVIIDASLVHKRSDGRYRYTLAHELAHWVIDRDYFTQIGETAAMTKKAAKSSDTDAAIERQATRLGSYILMPKGMVKIAYYHNRNCGNVIATISELFGVSAQAMEIRLNETGLLA
jgi:hypothetical protein